MIRNYFLLCLLAYCVAGIVAHEAIVGGHKAEKDKFTYHVTILVHGVGYDCGGSLIGQTFVLTAAHCVYRDNHQFEPRPISILAGTNDLHERGEGPRFVKVKKIYVPTEYNPPSTTSIADIAVLKLEHPLEFSKHIGILALPMHAQQSFAGITAKITGFGWNWIEFVNQKESGGNNDTQLRYADVDILSVEQCEKDYAVHHVPHNYICGRVKQRDDKSPHGICIGDSGGGLVQDHHTIVGVLSNGRFDCAERKFPAIYTAVSYYLPFIYNAIQDKKSKNIRSHDVKHS